MKTEIAGLTLAAITAVPLAGQQQPSPFISNPVVTSLTMFAGTPTGLWRSRDWGGTWERVTSGVVRESGAVHFILPVGPRVYVGADAGLLVSEDFGSAWTQLFKDAAVFGMLPSRYPQSDATVFLATARGLLKSADAGKTFAPTSLMGAPVHRLEWPGPTLLVATGLGVMTSNDAGDHFSFPGPGLPPGEVRALAVSSFFAADPVLFAGVGGTGVHRSGDGGRSWTSAGLSSRTVTDLVWLGPLLYAVTDVGLFRSQDAGAHWAPLVEGLGSAVPRRILFPLTPSAAEVFLATDRGVYRSGDGGLRWQPSGLGSEVVLCLATFPPAEKTPGKGKKNR